MDENTKYLYQYTSIETLASILANRNIKFNSLENVDDLEEVKASDIERYGKFTFVSCWTDKEKENISLWSMYTEKMKGVRIKLPINCLELNKSEINNQLEKSQLKLIVYNKNNMIEETHRLQSVGYDPDLKETEAFFKHDDGGFLNPFNIGTIKDHSWIFQQEVRYIINTVPKEITKICEFITYEEMINYKNIMEKFNYIPKEGIFIKIKKTDFEKMEILLGPMTTVGDRIIVESLIDKYNPKIPKPKDSYFKDKLKNK